MDVRWHLPLEALVRLERAEKDAARSKRLRIVILAIGGYTAPAIAMSVGLSRRICQRWIYRYNEEGLEGLNDRRGQEPKPPLTPEQAEQVCRRLEAGPTARGPGLLAARRRCPADFGHRVRRAPFVARHLSSAASTGLLVFASPAPPSTRRRKHHAIHVPLALVAKASDHPCPPKSNCGFCLLAFGDESSEIRFTSSSMIFPASGWFPSTVTESG